MTIIIQSLAVHITWDAQVEQEARNRTTFGTSGRQTMKVCTIETQDSGKLGPTFRSRFNVLYTGVPTLRQGGEIRDEAHLHHA